MNTTAMNYPVTISLNDDVIVYKRIHEDANVTWTTHKEDLGKWDEVCRSLNVTTILNRPLNDDVSSTVHVICKKSEWGTKEEVRNTLNSHTVKEGHNLATFKLLSGLVMVIQLDVVMGQYITNYDSFDDIVTISYPMPITFAIKEMPIEYRDHDVSVVATFINVDSFRCGVKVPRPNISEDGERPIDFTVIMDSEVWGTPRAVETYFKLLGHDFSDTAFKIQTCDMKLYSYSLDDVIDGYRAVYEEEHFEGGDIFIHFHEIVKGMIV